MEIDRIEKAIHSGEVLRVRYFGGSEPGSERHIKPLSVAGGTVRAQCLQSGEPKTFTLAKLELVVEGVASAQAKSFVLSAPDLPPHETVASFAASITAKVELLGWHVESIAHSLTLHRKFKSGKPMKASDVSITYEEIAYDLMFDGEKTVEMNYRPRERPWVVSANKQTTKTFADSGKAHASFLKLAEQLAPCQPE